MLSLREFRRHFCSKALGFGLTRLCKTTKTNDDLFALIIGKVFLSLCLFSEGVVGAICCCGIFDFWSKLAPKLIQQVKKIGPRVPQWTLKSVQGVPRRGSEKQVAKKTANAMNQFDKRLQNGSQHLKL